MVSDSSVSIFKNSCPDPDSEGLEPRRPCFDPDVPLGGRLKRQCFSGVEGLSYFSEPGNIQGSFVHCKVVERLTKKSLNKHSTFFWFS